MPETKMPACAGICVLAERGAAECGLESRARCGSRYRPTFPDRSSVGGVRTRAHDAKTGRKIDLYIPNPEAPDGGPAQATHTDRHMHASLPAARAAAKAKLQDMNRSTAEGELEMMGRGDISAEKRCAWKASKPRPTASTWPTPSRTSMPTRAGS
ncbi:hypothetical protein [Ralstonia mannitolilytica]|uniref:hypothetical protein n=1 Tax=Ralstonia mannitolilytica TaxID=105219 RepID=UPI000AD7A47B|nr:hypothetical protein [Ralstonia mannitolilytica]